VVVNNLRRTALKGTLWSALQQLGDRGIRILVYLVLARLLAPDAFGIVALSVVFVEFMQLFLNQGLTAAIVQREDLDPEHLDSAFWGNIAFGIVLGGMCVAGADVFANIAGERDIAPIIRWLAIGFPLTALSGVQDAVLRRALNFRALAVRSFASQLVGGTVALGMAFMGYGVWSLVALEIVKAAVGVIVLWTASRWRPRLRFSLSHYRDLFAFGVNMMGVQILQFFRGRADYFLVGAFLGTTSLGYYSVAKQLVNATTHLLSGSVGPVMWSTFTRLQSDSGRLGRAIVTAAGLLALISWPVYVGGALVAPDLVPVTLGNQWIPSIPIVQAFMVASAINVLSGPLITAITAVGAVRWRLALELVVAVVTLGALILALPHGVAAVAWAFTICLVALLPIEFWCAAQLLPFRLSEYLRRAAPPAAAAFVMACAVFALRWVSADALSQPVLLATSMVLGATLYVGVLSLGAPAWTREAIADLRIAFKRGPRPEVTDIGDAVG